MTHPQLSRFGFTAIELTVATSLTLLTLGLVAGLAVWHFRERANLQARELALEAANNALEDAFATPWESLTPAWAKSRPLPDDIWLPDGKLDVTVAEEAGDKGLKRVTARVSWQASADRPRTSVELVGFFADRRGEKGGSK